jgi:hypothetical protein
VRSAAPNCERNVRWLTRPKRGFFGEVPWRTVSTHGQTKVEPVSLLSLCDSRVCVAQVNPKPVEMLTLCVNRRTLYLSFIRLSQPPS